MRWGVTLHGWSCRRAGVLLISCKPGINTSLKSEAVAIIWDWLASWEVKAVIDDPDMANVDILLRCWTSMDAMPKVATEGTPLGSCAILVVKEVGL